MYNQYYTNGSTNLDLLLPYSSLLVHQRGKSGYMLDGLGLNISERCSIHTQAASQSLDIIANLHNVFTSFALRNSLLQHKS